MGFPLDGVQALPSVANHAGPPIGLAERAEGFVWLLPPGSALLPPAPISAPASRSEEVFKAGKREREENVLLSFRASPFLRNGPDCFH